MILFDVSGLCNVRSPDVGVNMDRLEILIDKLLFYVPTDLPFLTSLMMRAEGRYIIFGFAVVVTLLLVWLLLLLLQMMFAKDQRKSAADKALPVELSETTDAPTADETNIGQGFSFFKKEPGSESESAGEDAALKVIEQEMLAVRQLYNNGHLIKEVYVSETRRLYEKARTLKTSQPG
jgi:hypothetical protein